MGYKFEAVLAKEVEMSKYKEYKREPVRVCRFDADRHTKMWINEARCAIWENNAYEEDGNGRVVIIRTEK